MVTDAELNGGELHEVFLFWKQLVAELIGWLKLLPFEFGKWLDVCSRRRSMWSSDEEDGRRTVGGDATELNANPFLVLVSFLIELTLI